MSEILGLERVAARHWRGTEEEWLGGWLLRAAEGFTGRANSALPLGDPGLPLAGALDAVARWYRARGLRPMIAVPLPLGTDCAGYELDNHLSERTWLTRPGRTFVMVADLAAVAPARELAPGTEFRVDAEPDDAWLAMYHYRGQERQPPVMRKVLTSAPFQIFTASPRNRPGDTPGSVVPARAGFSLRLSSWLPVCPGARPAREAGNRTLTSASSPTTNRAR